MQLKCPKNRVPEQEEFYTVNWIEGLKKCTNAIRYIANRMQRLFHCTHCLKKFTTICTTILYATFINCFSITITETNKFKGDSYIIYLTHLPSIYHFITYFIVLCSKQKFPKIGEVFNWILVLSYKCWVVIVVFVTVWPAGTCEVRAFHLMSTTPTLRTSQPHSAVVSVNQPQIINCLRGAFSVSWVICEIDLMTLIIYYKNGVFIILISLMTQQFCSALKWIYLLKS